MKRRTFITLLGGAAQQPKAARELSRAAFGMNCRRGPVPFIACANNKLACVGFRAPYFQQGKTSARGVPTTSTRRPAYSFD
jgi:hypothetical protein